MRNEENATPPIIGDKRMLNYKEAAWYCGLAEKTLRNACARGAARPFPVRPKKWGKKALFDKEDLDRFFDGLSNAPPEKA